MSAAPDTTNHFLVLALGNIVFIPLVRCTLTRGQALNLAAWIVARADREDKFPTLLAAVRNT
jgi:hypothetical protein